MKYQVVPFKMVTFEGDWHQDVSEAGVIAYYPGTGACIVEVEPTGEFSKLHPVISTWSRKPGEPIGTTWIVGRVVHLPEDKERMQI